MIEPEAASAAGPRQEMKGDEPARQDPEAKGGEVLEPAQRHAEQGFPGEQAQTAAPQSRADAQVAVRQISEALAARRMAEAARRNT